MENLFEILGKLGFDWRVALANFVNFLIILFFLKKYAFRPIKKIISDRRDKINQGLENAKKAEAELMMAGTKKDEIIKNAGKEAGAIISEASEKRSEIIEKAKIKAESEAAGILASAAENREIEARKMRREIKERSVELILDSVEKIFKEKINRQENEKYVKNLLD